MEVVLFILIGISCVLSIGLYRLALRAAARWKRPALAFLGMTCLAILGAGSLPIASPIPLQLLLLTILLALNQRWRLQRLSACALFASVLPYALVGTVAYLSLRSLVAAYPMESLEARLPERSFDRVGMSAKELDDLDETFAFGYWPRDFALKRMHEDTLALFVQRYGFGASRMIGFDTLLRENNKPRPPKLPQPGIRLEPSAAQIDEPMSAIDGSNGPLRELHLHWMAGLFGMRRFGYFVDRRHVSGFVPHGIRADALEPKPEKPHVRTVDLVGLVVHPEPVVYVSSDLPDMEELAKIPRRPLDRFETNGLEAFAKGEPIFARKTASGIRVLGPIRAASSCTKCHGCERGQLLGALSYVID
jgi:hypothetical protein